MRFINGLRDDVKAMVLVQRPSDLDTACILAQLQDEVVDPSRRKEFRRPNYSSSSKSFSKGPHPLPAPPKIDKPNYAAEDRRGTDAARHRSPTDKLAALRAYRRAQGLCVKCAEKWHKDHRCAKTVQLHVLQDLWELFQLDDEDCSQSAGSNVAEEQVFMALSKAAVTGSEAPRTMRIMGVIQDVDMLILIDSGSSHTFISSNVAKGLHSVSLLP
uniref:Retrotransposon gag domain-containing protein n=1 Tax=Arundo donax TaxID=35708 RepID=A0A0A8ZHS9_ARUDO